MRMPCSSCRAVAHAAGCCFDAASAQRLPPACPPICATAPPPCAAPWWKWVLSVRTAADAGAGTDADIRLAGLTCGAFAGLGSPVSLTARCNARLDEAAPCFE